MRGLIDGGHRPVAAIRGKICDHHGGIGKRHQGLPADRAAIAAQPFGERHAQYRARLPVGRGARWRFVVDRFDRQVEINHPGCEHIAEHSSRFLDAELGGSWLLHLEMTPDP